MLGRKKNSSVNTPRRRSGTPDVATTPSDGDLFRRNRTLTGSLSSGVRSSAERLAGFKSSRVQTHELRHHRRRLGLMFLLAAGTVAVLFLMINNFVASVSVTVSDQPVNKLMSDYKGLINEYLASRPVERLSFAINIDTLTGYVQLKAPEVSRVTLQDISGMGESAFRVEVRRPVASWTITGNKRYVDASGVSFTKNYFDEPVVRVTDQTNLTVDGQIIVSNRFLGFIGQAVSRSAKNGLIVSEVMLPSGTNRQVQLKLDKYNYPVKLSVDRPVGEQIEDMVRAVKYLDGKNQNPQYLDVRVSRRAFYR
ncbi:MAG: hypothetical protein WBB94_02690 [Candidatus Saccharimonadaceae bacterium]